MTRRFSSGASMLGIATVISVLISCSTPQTRISDHPDLYQSLSSRDQALKARGKFVLECHEARCGWHGVHPIKKLSATWRALRRRLGSIFIMLRTHTIHTTDLDPGVLGLPMIPARVTAWDILGSASLGDTPESAWQGGICITMGDGRSYFSAAPSMTHSTGRTSHLVSLSR